MPHQLLTLACSIVALRARGEVSEVEGYYVIAFLDGCIVTLGLKRIDHFDNEYRTPMTTHFVFSINDQEAVRDINKLGGRSNLTNEYMKLIALRMEYFGLRLSAVYVERPEVDFDLDGPCWDQKPTLGMAFVPLLL